MPIIPQQLQQKQIQKPPTRAEMLKARQQPTQQIPISPQQLEAQQQAQLETEIRKETQGVQSEIAKVEQDKINEMRVLNEKLDNANRRGDDASVQKYTDKIDEARMFYVGKIGALNEGLNLLQQGNLYRAKDISTYAQQVGRAEKRAEYSKTIRQQLRREYLTKIEAQQVEAISPAQIKTEIAADPMLKVQYETYKSAGYSNIQAMLLAQESVKQQQSFSPGKAKEILGGLATADIDFNVWKPVVEPMSIAPTTKKTSLVSTALSIIRPLSYIGVTPVIDKAVVTAAPKVFSFMKETPTPLEYISGKIVKYDVPFFGVPQLIGLGISGMTLKKPSEVSVPLWKAREKGEEIISNLEQIQVQISEGIRPIEKEHRLILEKEINKYTTQIEKHNKQVKQLETEIKSYEKNPTELKYKELTGKGERLEEEASLLEKDYDRIENLSEFFETQKRKVPKVVRAAQGVWVSLLSAPVGLATLGTGLLFKPEETLAETAKGIFGLPKAFVEDPIKVGSEIAGQLAFFYLVGAPIRKIKAVRLKSKIREGIATGETKVTSKGILNKKRIDALKVSATEKAKLRNLVKQGNTIRMYDTYIKYPKKTKYTPDVHTTFVEVMDNYGNIIERINIGKLRAVLKGKRIDRFAVSDAIEKLNEKTGNIQGLQELIIYEKVKTGIDLITGKPKAKYVKAEKYPFYYDIKTIKATRGKRGFTLGTEATYYKLLKKAKRYKGEPLLKGYGFTEEGVLVYPEYDFISKGAKPYAKGTFTEIGVSAGKNIQIHKIKGFEDLFVKTQEGFATFGRGTIQTIKAPTKPFSISGWVKNYRESLRPYGYEKPLSEVVVKYPKPKAYKTAPVPDYLLQDFAPLMVGGKGKGISQWYGKQVLVPEAFTTSLAPAVIAETFTGTLPSAFASSMGWTQGITGMSLGLGTIFKSDVDVKIAEKERLKYIEATKVKLDIEQLLIGKEKLLPAQKVITEQLTLLKEEAALKPQLLLKQQQTQIQQLKQVQKLLQVQPVAPPAVPPVPPPVTPFTFFFPSEKPKYVKEKPYLPEKYVDATKEKKAHWKRLSNKPMTFKSAMSFASESVDKTISARGRAVPMKPKIVKGKKVYPKKVLDLGTNYFGVNRHKFRTWKQKKGRRTALKKGNFIELQKFRSDSVGEKLALQRGRGKVLKRRTPFGF